MRLRALTPDEREAWLTTAPVRLVGAWAAQHFLPEPEATERAVAILARRFSDGPQSPSQLLWWLEADGRVLGDLWMADDSVVLGPAYDLGPDGCRSLVAAVDEAALDAARELVSWQLLGPERRLRGALLEAGFRGGSSWLVRRLDDQQRTSVMSETSATSESSESSAGALVLRPMTPARFETWCAESIAGYAEEIALAGRVEGAGAARQQAQDEFAQLLPDGLASPGDQLWTAHQIAPEHEDDVLVEPTTGDVGDEIGYLWVDVSDRSDGPHADVFDVAVDEAHRGRGLGRELMLAAHRSLAEQGVCTVGLNVFAHNVVARRLYDSLGYHEAIGVLTRMPRPRPEPGGGGPR